MTNHINEEKQIETNDISRFLDITDFNIDVLGNVMYAAFQGIMPEQGREYSSETEDSMEMYDRMLVNRSAKLWRNILLFFPAAMNALPKESSSILELGCSNCNLRTYLYRNGPETYYVGLDAREDALVEAMKETFTRPYGLVKYDLNLEWMFHDNVFDVVAFYDTLEHLADREAQLRVLRGVYESLSNNGTLLLSTSCKDSEGNNSYDEFHTSEIDREEFEQDVKGIGFIIEESFALDFHDSHKDWRLPFTTRKLMNSFKMKGFYPSALRTMFGTLCNDLPRNIFYRLSKEWNTLAEDLEILIKRFSGNDIGMYVIGKLKPEILNIKFLGSYARLTLTSNDDIYLYDKTNGITRIETKIDFVDGITGYKEVTNSTCLADVTNKDNAVKILERLLR